MHIMCTPYRLLINNNKQLGEQIRRLFWIVSGRHVQAACDVYTEK